MTPSTNTPEENLVDQQELAKAIRLGSRRRPQCFGSYFDERGGSCALGAAYDGMYEMPREAREPGEIVPRNLERLFHCLEDVVKRCPEPALGDSPLAATETGHCRKRLPLGAMIVHLNDDHGWTREEIAEWLSIGAPGPATGAGQIPRPE
jgi:hypothetical protein